jgi:hypothetical protein
MAPGVEEDGGWIPIPLSTGGAFVDEPCGRGLVGKASILQSVRHMALMLSACGGKE